MEQAYRGSHFVQRVTVRVLRSEDQRSLLADLILNVFSTLLVGMMLGVVLARPPLILQLLE